MNDNVFNYKRTYSTLDALNAALADGTITTISIGDIYSITNAGGTDASGTPIKAGDNVVVRQVIGDSAPYIVEWDVISYSEDDYLDMSFIKDVNADD